MKNEIDLDQLRKSIPIRELAESLGLKVRGKNAHCFNVGMHKNGDKRASLGFDLEKNRFKCFACGVSGSIIDLYMNVKGVKEGEAIRALSDRVGLNRPRNVKKEVSRERFPSPKNVNCSPIYEALKAFCGGVDEKSLEYLTGKSRGLTPETIARFGLFSIKDYSATDKHLKDKYSQEQLKEAGLESDKGHLIFYKHKILIPFLDNGRIVFLQGRRTDQGDPRYLHVSRPVPLFNKDALKDAKPGEKVYLCEGVFDAMILEQDGYRAVAILGVNNFKPDMVPFFKGLDVVLCLDNDESGKAGTKTLAKIFRASGQTVKTKVLPDGVKDTTEFYLKNLGNEKHKTGIVS